MKKKYNAPKITVVDIETESLLNVISSPFGGSTDTFGAKGFDLETEDMDYDDYYDEY